ncbi:hypothetical protein [Streptomyces sp. DSM 40907]|uniref:hypothetical protein n=1 Tax=Streptomyces kutzneri TaxID=3051179 RepID=UPI0028D63435|nr:hypothetical protein [Streptomyces sp. DSM 40907]
MGSATTAVAAEGPVAPGRTSAWRGGKSANGWPVLSTAPTQLIEGSEVSVPLLDGDVATILLHLARRFHYEIDTLRQGEVTGHTASRTVAADYESNHLSGTAIAIRPSFYPIGMRDGLYRHELVVIRDILAELDGTVAWGGDAKTPKESHFHIALRPGHPKIKGVARKIRGWNDTPGQGAGTVDAFEPSRRRAAAAFTS